MAICGRDPRATTSVDRGGAEMPLPVHVEPYTKTLLPATRRQRHSPACFSNSSSHIYSSFSTPALSSCLPRLVDMAGPQAAMDPCTRYIIIIIMHDRKWAETNCWAFTRVREKQKQYGGVFPSKGKFAHR